MLIRESFTIIYIRIFDRTTSQDSSLSVKLLPNIYSSIGVWLSHNISALFSLFLWNVFLIFNTWFNFWKFPSIFLQLVYIIYSIPVLIITLSENTSSKILGIACVGILLLSNVKRQRQMRKKWPLYFLNSKYNCAVENTATHRIRWWRQPTQVTKSFDLISTGLKAKGEVGGVTCHVDSRSVNVTREITYMVTANNNAQTSLPTVKTPSIWCWEDWKSKPRSLDWNYHQGHCYWRLLSELL